MLNRSLRRREPTLVATASVENIATREYCVRQIATRWRIGYYERVSSDETFTSPGASVWRSIEDRRGRPLEFSDLDAAIAHIEYLWQRLFGRVGPYGGKSYREVRVLVEV